MLLERFYDDKLAQASYLVGCQATGESLVIDPNRDVRQYERAAAREGLRITHVIETHIHADFVSGSRELARRTGARLLLSDEGGPEWRYAFAADSGAALVSDGNVVMVGRLRFEVLHTPGHTPEHIALLLTDTPATSHPMAVFTGDFVFAGDVGRPDLLERAARQAGTMVAGARLLHSSIRKFRALPDYLQLWPGHGAGSACGKALGAVPSTTLGYEKLASWAFAIDDREEFVRRVLDGQPDAPAYFARMKAVNREGPAILGDRPRPGRMPAGALAGVLARSDTVIDTRSAADFAERHVPGTINIPLNRSFTTWAGSLVPYDRAIHLLVPEDRPGDVDEIVRDLTMIGLDRIEGVFGGDAVHSWAADGRQAGVTPQISAPELARLLRDESPAVLDVRAPGEWDAGHIPGVPNIPLGQLPDRIAELPGGTPLIVHCQSGARSAIAASVLRAKGVARVVNLAGGFAAWRDAGLPVVAGTRE